MKQISFADAVYAGIVALKTLPETILEEPSATLSVASWGF